MLTQELTVVIVLTVAQCPAPETRADAAPVQPLFDAVLISTGEGYVQARRKFLAHPDAEAHLRRVMTDRTRSAEVRWLAQILFLRQRSSEHLRRLEEILQEKMWITDPHPVPKTGRTVLPVVFSPNEEIPSLESLRRRWRGDAEQWHRYYQQKRLPPELSGWNLLMGEILLKQYVPPPHPEAKPRPLFAEPDFGPWLEPADYLRNAIHVLEKLGESRARPAIERLLRDRRTDPGVRGAAVHALGRLGDEGSLELLAEVVKEANKSGTTGLQFTAIRSLAHLGGPVVLPLLCELHESVEDPRLRQLLSSPISHFTSNPHLTFPLDQEPDESVYDGYDFDG